MPIKNPKELFVSMLNHVRHGTERSAANHNLAFQPIGIPSDLG
jgi:hypothetical protein